jgi:GT2 family glycosyltransferase
MNVAVLIVNWNGGGLLRRCLQSLLNQQRHPDRIIVVDNASTDDSLRQAARELEGTELIRLATNAGFAAANNIAARGARGCDAIALLNPDAFPEPHWLGSLVAAAERHPDVSAFASQMVLASSPSQLDGAGDSYHVSGRAWRNGHMAPRASGPTDDVEVFAACAAAALYRREAFEDAGGFDERYFSYFEDVDLGFRMRLRGHRCLYVHSAVVHHMSSAIGGYRSDFAVYYGERNAVWTFFKNMPTPLLLLYLPQHLALNLASLFYYPLRGQGGAVLRAKLDAVRGLPSLLRTRKAVQATRRVDAWALRRALRRGFAVPYVRRYSSAPIAAATSVLTLVLATL